MMTHECVNAFLDDLIATLLTLVEPFFGLAEQLLQAFDFGLAGFLVGVEFLLKMILQGLAKFGLIVWIFHRAKPVLDEHGCGVGFWILRESIRRFEVSIVLWLGKLIFAVGRSLKRCHRRIIEGSFLRIHDVWNNLLHFFAIENESVLFVCDLLTRRQIGRSRPFVGRLGKRIRIRPLRKGGC